MVQKSPREATVAYLGFLRLLAILEEYEIKLRDLQVYELVNIKKEL